MENVSVYAVSRCLLGEKCRYDGKTMIPSSTAPWRDSIVIPVCPEVMGGLCVPRPACEIVGGDGVDVLNGSAGIVASDGRDMTQVFLKGAKEGVLLCKEKNVTKAYLKAKSPSCGHGTVYDGSFSGTVRSGDGVFTAMLRQIGIEVVSVEGGNDLTSDADRQ